MLHEILLSLSGQPSPLFAFSSEEDVVSENAFPLSPPEKALLTSLARLSRLHARLREHTSLISSSHPSIICRAVASAINTHHLGGFQRKILEVEKAILAEDSAYVGGYGIVPLSTIVGEFSPWTRRLEWLWEVVRFVLPENSTSSTHGCTGSALIDYLRTESQTGYLDLEEIALHLITVAESAWMRQLSTWLLYGNLPIFGKDDFFIQEDNSSQMDDSSSIANFVMQTSLLPKFVSLHTASSILFIGKTLNHITAKRKGARTGSSGSPAPPVTLQGEHIAHLASLASPISASKLSNAVDAIRLSLSQSVLSKLLPLPKILEILSVLHDFLLLGRGEFATALVSHADARLRERHRRPELLAGKVWSLTELEGLVVKDGDVLHALAQTWAELYALQNEEDPVDESLDLARDLVRLSITATKSGHTVAPLSDEVGSDLVTEISDVSFEDLLFPTRTSLSVEVRAPLDLFLSMSDIAVYSKIHSYLLGIRRAQIRINDLWKHSFLRKSYPSPWGPPRSNTPFGQSKLQLGRQRDNLRLSQMRPVWATSSASLFVLSEIGSFFQGEVVNGCWQHFREWIQGGLATGTPSTSSRPGTSASRKSGYSDSPIEDRADIDCSSQTPQRLDPETLTVAHRRYLFSLVQSLFLTDTPFTEALRSLLSLIDHFIALIIRLESVQRNMDLETDEGVVDALADYPKEETELLEALRTARMEVEGGIRDVVARLRDIDDSRSGEGRKMFDLVKHARATPLANRQNGSSVNAQFCQYLPRKTAGVDQLLMKLDFGHANGSLGPTAPVVGDFFEME